MEGIFLCRGYVRVMFFLCQDMKREGGVGGVVSCFLLPHGVQHMPTDKVFSESAGQSLKIGSVKPKRFPFKLRCSECHKETVVRCDPYDVAAWRKGQPIQQAMPYLTANERELFISNICGRCYDDLCQLFESVKP
jgi:hypothetical protein